jgi:DNA/RNA endonuclease YhcR with UshA esterase domain
MKTILLTFAAAMLAIRLQAADTNAPAPVKIGALEATNYYDQEMIVTGKVVQVTIRPTVTFLNLEERYPESPFAVVILHGHSSFYGDANVLRGKSVEITGKIKNYHGKPEIVLDSTNQLSVLGVTNLSLFLNPVVPAAGAPAIASPTNTPPASHNPEIM